MNDCEKIPVPQGWDFFSPSDINNNSAIAGWAASEAPLPSTASLGVIGFFKYSNGAYMEIPLPVDCVNFSNGIHAYINEDEEIALPTTAIFRLKLQRSGSSTELSRAQSRCPVNDS